MPIRQLHSPVGPGAEEGPEVGHVVPEVDANGGVEAQLVEAYVAVRSGRCRDLRQALGEVLALQQVHVVTRGLEGAEQKCGGVVDDVGVRAVQHGRGEQQGPL